MYRGPGESGDKMKITRHQLRRIIKESMMKDAYGEFQDHILAIGLDQAGEFGVQEIVDYQSRSKTPYPLEHDEILQIMRDMVDAGMLTGGSFGNSFSVHPDYMQLEEDKRAPEKEFNGQAHEQGRRDAETDNIDYDRYDADVSYAAGVDSLDQDVDVGMRFEEAKSMKITKRQLRRIIKEEKAKLQEQSTPAAGTTGMEIQPSIDAIEEILNGLNDDGLTNADLIKLLEGIILDINRGFVGESS